MEKLKILFITMLLNFSLLAIYAQSGTEVYFASTPCDDPLKSIIGIGEISTIDFIRWELVLKFNETGANTFSMNINYGESKPNTLGFISNGYQKNTEGSFEISKHKSNAIVYILKSKEFKSILSLIRLSKNVLHILTADNKLMVGNGGWSYSLNKETPGTQAASILPSTISYFDSNVSNSMVRFDGRTPCSPVGEEYDLTLGENCIKIKWRLDLFFDPVSKEPSTFSLHRTNHRSGPINGTWVIEKGTRSNPDAIICRLNFEKPFKSIPLLIADENVMYFLDKDLNIMKGDENFSFALNRK